MAYDDKMGETEGLGFILYTGTRDELQEKLRKRDDFITKLKARTIEDISKILGLELRVSDLEQENDALRGFLARGNDPCIYCQLPKADMAKCQSGFPGCARADDMLNDPHGPVG